ncbi:MAG: hypothetical protein HY722_06815 [Planctomycetes bacterium]|nr:hypothetical protein [Planctomycetota bacterium]
MMGRGAALLLAAAPGDYRGALFGALTVFVALLLGWMVHTHRRGLRAAAELDELERRLGGP